MLHIQKQDGNAQLCLQKLVERDIDPEDGKVWVYGMGE